MLASYAIKIEGHYSARAGRAMPMDAEWAKDGLDGPLYGVQARPETRASGRREALLEEYRLGTTPQPVVTGRAVGSRIAQGPVRLMRSAAPRRADRPVSHREGAGHRQHDAGLGTDHAPRRRHRDEPPR